VAPAEGPVVRTCCQRPGRFAVAARVAVAGGLAVALILLLTGVAAAATVTISGTARNAAGQGLAGVEISATKVYINDPGVGGQATTGATGAWTMNVTSVSLGYELAAADPSGVYLRTDSIGGQAARADGKRSSAGIGFVLTAGGIASGTATFSDGSPAVGEYVVISGVGLNGAAMTAADGTWTVRGLAAGHGRAWVQPSGHPQTWYPSSPSEAAGQQFDTFPATTVTGIAIEALDFGSISGAVVTSPSTTPLLTPGTGACDVYASLFDPAAAVSTPTATTSVDCASGAFGFAGITPGAWQVQILDQTGRLAPTWVGNADRPSATVISVASGQSVTGANATMSVGGIVAATVRTHTGAALPDTGVMVVDSTGVSLAYQPTDATGKVRFAGLPAGTYTLRADLAMGSPTIATVAVTLRATSTRTITFGLLTLALRAADTNHGLDGDASLFAQSGEQYALSGFDAAAGWSGEVPAGSYLVLANPYGDPADPAVPFGVYGATWSGDVTTRPLATPIAVTSGGTKAATITSTAMVAVRGFVGGPGPRVPDATAFSAYASDGHVVATTAANVEALSVPVGTRRFGFTDPTGALDPRYLDGKASLGAATSYVLTNHEASLDLPFQTMPAATHANAVAGTLVLAGGGAPTAIVVALTPTGSTSGMNGAGTPYLATPDAGGAFTLPNLSPGTYRLEVSDTCAARTTPRIGVQWLGGGFDAGAGTTVTVAASGQTAVGTMVLTPLARIAGRVFDASGVPLASTLVSATGLDGTPLYWTSPRADCAHPIASTSAADGSFTIDGVPTGTVFVQAAGAPAAPDQGFTTFAPTAATTVGATAFPATPGSTITGADVRLAVSHLSGTVTDEATGAAIADTYVAVTSLAPPPRFSAPNIFTDGAGRWSVAVPPGRYVVSATAPGPLNQPGYATAWNGDAPDQSHAPAILAVDHGAAVVPLHVTRLGRFTGALTTPGAGSYVVRIEALTASGRVAASTEAAAGGEYTLDLVPGTYSLLASDLQYTTDPVLAVTRSPAASIAAGATGTIDITMTTASATATTTALTASPATLASGATLTATATTTGGGARTGLTRFTLSTATNASLLVVLVPVSTSGVATLSTVPPYAGIGALFVSADYLGDASHAASGRTAYVRTTAGPATGTQPSVTTIFVGAAGPPPVLASGPGVLHVDVAAVGCDVDSCQGDQPSGTVQVFDESGLLGTGVATSSSSLGQGGGTVAGADLDVVLTAGAHHLHASYVGDPTYAPSSSIPALVLVGHDSGGSIAIAADTATPEVGQTVTFTSTVGAGATGRVWFLDGGQLLSSVALSGGGASYARAFAPGDHAIEAFYEGDSGHASGRAAVAITVGYPATPTPSTTALAASTTSVTSPNPVTFTATVDPAPVQQPRSVGFFADGTFLGSATVEAGSATLTTTVLRRGTDHVTARYEGEADGAGQSIVMPSSSPPVTITVGPAPAATTTALAASPTTAPVGQAVVFTATVSASTAHGLVTFRDGTATIGVADVASGVATISTAALGVGSHSVRASYGGDDADAASTSSSVAVTVTQSQPPVDTTTSLAVTPTPAPSGTAVTITATVTPTAATGTVTFTSDGVTIGQAALSSGTASIVVSNLTVGTHALAARYAGDTSHTSSATASTTPVTVTSAGVTPTTTTVTASPSSVTSGQPTLLRAIVSPSGATGTVTFRSDGALVGTQPVASGGATANPTLPIGTHEITAAYAGDSSHGSSTSGAVTATVLPSSTTTYVPLTPLRVLDTRTGTGVASARLIGPGGVVRLSLAGAVPAGATAVALNVTGLDGTGSTFVTVWPDGSSRPLASNLNLMPGQVAPNAVIAKLGDSQTVDLYNDTGFVDLIADLQGYYVSGYVPLTPVRVLDTRTGTGAPAAAVGPGGVVHLSLAGRVPADASAVALNVTGVDATAATFVTVWPGNTTRPLASNLNLVQGQVAPNLVTVKLGAGQVVDLFNFAGSLGLIADLQGYATAGYTGVTPLRVLDTRFGTGAPKAPLGPGGVVRLDLSGVVPAGTTAVVLNVTGLNGTVGTFVTVWPDGAPRPLASNLNLAPGQVAPNLVIAKVGPGMVVDLYSFAGNLDLIADLQGTIS
jgi:hypothetical protein